MADEQQELRRIIWTEVFSFPHIFKSFRMAIHPTKLILALAAVLLVYLLGRCMDRVWGWANRTNQVADVYTFYDRGGADYCKMMDARKAARPVRVAQLRRDGLREKFAFTTLRSQYRQIAGAVAKPGMQPRPAGAPNLLSEFESAMTKFQQEHEDLRKEMENPPPVLQEPAKMDWEKQWNQYVDDIDAMFSSAEELIDKAKDSAKKTIEGLKAEDRELAEKHNKLDRTAMTRALWNARLELLDKPEQELFGKGPFATLMAYESQCFSQAVRSVWKGRVFGGFDRLADGARPAIAYEPTAPAVPAALVAGGADPEALGVFAWIYLMAWGAIWLLCTHWVYALIFLGVSLAIWALFGGAIARVAALHAAREEKISAGQAIKFALGKFFSFLTAPLIPLAIILLVGVLMGLGGLLGTFAIGDVIVGALFFVALALGAMIAFLSIGLVAGLPLMYPTIAVEGSDSFDAISRSFSYVFARPWRYILYVALATVYGAICYTFVRLFAYLAMGATHLFVARGFFGGGLGWNKAPELADSATKMDLLWTRPTFDNLAGKMNFAAMNWHETTASFLLHIWVYLLVGLLTAFVLSFLVSSQTVIYYLLRRKVDATDFDDVYIEETEEGEEALAGGEAPAAPSAETAGEGEQPGGPT